MSCLNCGQDVSGVPELLDIHAPDGTLHTLPRAFCPRCGWPLAVAEVRCWPPGEILLSGDRPGELSVVISNDGNGVLYYSLDHDSRLLPAALPTLHGTVDAGRRREVVFRVNRAAVAEPVDTASLLAHTLTATPAVQSEPRRGPIEGLWREHPLRVTIRSLPVGPVDLDCRHVLFGLDVDEAYVGVRNYGGVPLEATITATQGFLVSCEAGAGFAATARTTLRPGRADDAQRPRPGVSIVRLRAPQGGPVTAGQLSLNVPGQPPLTVTLERIVPAPPPLPEFRYTVGLDFGTSKTAVAWVDQLALPPLPQVLEWSRSDPTGDPRWLPSAVFYDRQYGQAVFGDEAFAQAGASVTEVGVRLDAGGRYTSPRGTLFVGMKMFIRAEEPPAREGPTLHQVVVDYFRHVFEQLEQRTPVRLAEANLLISLPVLDTPAEHQQQEERTRAAAAAAGALFGLRPAQILFEKEPVCAAVDLVRLQTATPTQQAALRDGDWICVFDCGAGTTDLSLLQVSQQGGEWRFSQIEPLGFEWGGDNLDVLLYDWLMGFWCSPEDPANIPAGGPVTLKPRGTPGAVRRAKVIDADAPHRPAAPGEIDWFALMREHGEFVFSGAVQPVSRSELLGAVSRFKEQYLASAAPSPATEGRLTSETPVRPLGPAKTGAKGPWAPLRIEDAITRLSLEFLEMLDESGVPLKVSVPALCRRLAIRSPQWVCPVGGTTLVRGWREAVQREPLRLSGIVEAPADLRRLHVARGAAQRLLFRVEQRLPEPARLQVCDYTPGRDPQVLEEHSLAAGAAPGDRQETTVIGTLPLEPGRRLLFRVWLGERLVRQEAVAWFEGLALLQARSLGAQPAVRLEATLAYRRGPTRLELEACWLLAADRPTAIEPVKVVLPRFGD